MSVRRPTRRYIGFRYQPGSASRRKVARAIEHVWDAGPGDGSKSAPRLLVCEQGSGILVIATAGGDAMRAALSRSSGGGAGIVMEPVVTSGTIITVKERMGLTSRRRR